jgi:hypothetical protein
METTLKSSNFRYEMTISSHVEKHKLSSPELVPRINRHTSASEGDVIAVLFECYIPFILRPRANRL